MTTDNTQKAPVMTVKEFLALSDRERDAYVAEKVLGYVWRGGLVGNCRGLVPPLSDEAKFWPEATGEEKVAYDYHRFVLHFTTERNAALVVVDRMEGAWWWTIKSPFYPGAPWTAGLSPHNVTGWNGRPDHFASAPTFALAVCICALKATGALREEE